MSLAQMCFPVNFVKFLRTPFFTEHLRWLLLAILRHIQNPVKHLRWTFRNNWDRKHFQKVKLFNTKNNKFATGFANMREKIAQEFYLCHNLSVNRQKRNSFLPDLTMGKRGELRNTLNYSEYLPNTKYYSKNPPNTDAIVKTSRKCFQ